jgi:non-canonical poly(A) RNA polymerase PAPD5/7
MDQVYHVENKDDEDDWRNDDFLSLDVHASSSSSSSCSSSALGAGDNSNDDDKKKKKKSRKKFRRKYDRDRSRSDGEGGDEGGDDSAAMDVSPSSDSDLFDDDDDDDDDSLPPWMALEGSQNSRRANNPLVALHNEIVGFASLMEPTEDERRVRDSVVEQIREVARREFGLRSQVLVFGSQATGLFLPSSDIDLVILTKSGEEVDEPKEGSGGEGSGGGDETDKKGSSLSSQSPLQRFASALREAWYSELSYLEVIENTRIPLVKCTHAPTNISVDVSFDLPGGGPPAARLMTTYLDALPALRPLTLVIKSFLAARGLNQPYTGGVGSFMVQVMIVAFLQQRERDAVINRLRPTLNIGSLLLEFFELFGLEFNYVTTGISIRNDGFFFPKGAPTKREIFYSAERPHLLALENPLDTTMDVGKSSFRIQIVQRAFKVAHNVLLSYVAEATPTAPSILATILPPTDEMLQRRRLKRRMARRQMLKQEERQQSKTSDPPGMDQPLPSKRVLSANDASSPSGKRQRSIAH